MAKTRWWGAPLDVGDRVRLQPRLDHLLDQHEPVFESAQPMTIIVSGVMIRELQDQDSNDLIVVSRFQLDKGVSVPRLHYMKNNVGLEWYGDFFDDTVLAVSDLFADTSLADDNRKTMPRITLGIQVYDPNGISRNLADSVGTTAQNAALLATVSYPQLAPFSALFNGNILVNLINSLNSHHQIIDDRITFEVAQADHGRTLLQPGHFVCFRDPVEEDVPLYIHHNRRVGREDGGEFADCSYVVLKVYREFLADRNREVDQGVARLIAELDGNQNGGQAALEFVRESIEAATAFKPLLPQRHGVRRYAATPESCLL